MKENYGNHRSEANKKTPKHDKITRIIHDNLFEFAEYLIKKYPGEFRDIDWGDEEVTISKPKLEMPVTFKKNNYSKEEVIGWIDLSFAFMIKGLREDVIKVIHIEIKPKINSVGDTIRQINFYRQHKEGLYVIATEDEDEESYFESQGILYINMFDFFLFLVETSDKEQEEEDNIKEA